MELEGFPYPRSATYFLHTLPLQKGSNNNVWEKKYIWNKIDNFQKSFHLLQAMSIFKRENFEIS